ncbi:MAG: RNA polymerase sigma factor [Pseudomonadales bacterium]
MNSKSVEDVLVRRLARRRDEASFRQLYKAHTPPIFGLGLRLSRSPQTAEDLVQETWVRAVRQLDQFQGTARFSTWLSAILVNCYREHVRSERRHAPALENAARESVATESATRESVGSESALSQDIPQALDLDAAIARLPDGFREVLVLHDVNGYTHREIAQLLEIQEGTSKSQLTRARARMRELLRDTPDATPKECMQDE